MIRLKEAVAYAKTKDISLDRGTLAKEMWRNSSDHTARTNFSNLANGKSKRIDIEQIPYLCKRLGVSADYLFGLTEYRNEDEKMPLLKEKINELKDLLDTF